MAKKHERTHARRAALALLYTGEMTDKTATSLAEEGPLLAEAGPLTEYAEALVRGVDAHRRTIDGLLASASENWALARMPIVDRSILRLATYEMMYVDDVPTSVTINEAIELAKDFGGADESHRFVNGVLGRIAKRLDEEGREAVVAQVLAAAFAASEAAASGAAASDAGSAESAADELSDGAAQPAEAAEGAEAADAVEGAGVPAAESAAGDEAAAASAADEVPAAEVAAEPEGAQPRNDHGAAYA